MTDLLAARLQMAMSLGFHIIFATVGIAMPLFMVISESRWMKTGKAVYRDLAQRWAKGTAIMFAVGAVSGTVLSFELGLLWPEFMAFAGPMVGLPFAMEGFAFFLEAIFIGIYLYGWDRISPKVHLFSGIMVLVCGAASGIFVVTVNAWMNAPTGFEMGPDGPTAIDPIAAMLNPASFTQVLHMLIGTFQALAFAVAAIHAWALLKGGHRTFHRTALGIVLPVGFVCALLQPLSGDLSAKMLAKWQPIKLAAMEAHWETERGAPFRIGGWPDEVEEETRYSLEIPYLLSFLAHGDPNAEVIGLKSVPPEDRPPVAIVHISFQLMVGFGMIMVATSCLGIWFWWRHRRLPDDPWFLKLLIWNGPLGMLAIEAGWIATEVGRQPWVIQGIMRTSDAVTPMPRVWITLTLFTMMYIALSIVVVRLMKNQVFATMEPADD